MAQHDYVIDNQAGAVVRSDLNSALQAVVTNNSGASAPSPTFANQWWFDTATDLLKQRSEDNTTWVTVARKDANGWMIAIQGVHLDTEITPTQIVANTDNYNPTGLATAFTLRLSTDASRDITGLAAQPGGTIKRLFNAGSFDVVLKHNVTSTAANRFYCGGSDFTLAATQSVLIQYDAGASRWVVLGVSPASGVALLNSEDQVLTGGMRVTSKSLGTVTSGTLTPDPGDRPLQHYINGGAHTLAPGANTGTYILDITNNASAGAITTSGWTKVAGDPFTTTNGHKFRCSCVVGDAGSLLIVQAMQ